MNVVLASRQPKKTTYKLDNLKKEYKMGFCKNHIDCRLVRVQLSNGKWRCRMQCQKCGAFASSYQKHPENFESLPVMNQEIIDKTVIESRKENREKQRRWKENYMNYLDSYSWKQKREEAFSHYKYACQLCGGKATQVHHLSYKNLGNEQMEDLRILCKDCHQEIHGRIF